MCFEFFKSPVFLWKFYIYPMFFMMEWFLMVSILVFKCTFANSVVYFSIIVSKIWCNFCFAYYVCNLALVGKGATIFIYTITGYWLYFLFCYYFFMLHIGNWFNICDAAIYFALFLLNILWYLWLFGKYFWIKRSKYLPMLSEMFFEKGRLNQIMFICISMCL